MWLRSFFTEENVLFLKSLCIGILIWYSFYILIPVNIINPLSSKVIWFILLNYITLVLGFFLTNYIFKKRTYFKNLQNKSEGFIYVVITLVYFSCVIRYVDLFFMRDVSFFNSISTNKYNVAKEDNFSITLGLLGVFRFLYFVPYLFYVVEKRRNKILFVLCFLLFLIPIIEGSLRGSRRLIFEPIGIFVTIICVYNFSKLFTRKTILIAIISVIFGVFISNLILKERAQENEQKKFLEKIYTAPYNDLLPLKSNTKEFLIKNKNPWIVNTTFTLVHVGQYIVHGVYEFDYLQKNNPIKRKGMYNGFIVIKLLNKLNLTKIELEPLMNPTKRVTYITSFGGLYLDFGWFSLIIMLLLGGIQKVIFHYSNSNHIFKPLLIIVVFSNIFLLIFNFFRAGMFVFMFIYLLAVTFFYLSKKKLHKNI